MSRDYRNISRDNFTPIPEADRPPIPDGVIKDWAAQDALVRRVGGLLPHDVPLRDVPYAYRLTREQLEALLDEQAERWAERA